jgi:hypothetical protein
MVTVRFAALVPILLATLTACGGGVGHTEKETVDPLQRAPEASTGEARAPQEDAGVTVNTPDAKSADAPVRIDDAGSAQEASPQDDAGDAPEASPQMEASIDAGADIDDGSALQEAATARPTAACPWGDAGTCCASPSYWGCLLLASANERELVCCTPTWNAQNPGAPCSPLAEAGVYECAP